jgi:hypothetical protein
MTDIEKQELVDVSVQLESDVVKMIKELAKIQGVSAADAIVRAVTRDKFFVSTVRDGGKVLIEDRDRKLYQIDVPVG